MKRIGLLSDTHGWVDAKYGEYFGVCDEIWHAGDIGGEAVVTALEQICPLRAVYGNIDGEYVRSRFPKIAHFKIEEVDVMMTHIGGYPGRYEPSIRPELYASRPRLFIAGHSHILKVIFDKNLNCLHINPGAAGLSGFQTVRTLIRLTIDKTNIKDLEIIELNRNE
ncbi:MAG: metallophosphatase family protein [Tannerella sp.]|jgi:putative phosphoesterase|nr:metallophosphatase family protein [Tannerella sp.]